MMIIALPYLSILSLLLLQVHLEYISLNGLLVAVPVLILLNQLLLPSACLMITYARLSPLLLQFVPVLIQPFQILMLPLHLKPTQDVLIMEGMFGLKQEFHFPDKLPSLLVQEL